MRPSAACATSRLKRLRPSFAWCAANSTATVRSRWTAACDGTLLDQWRYILDAGGLDWVGCCDHDNGGGREYSWWITQKLTDIFYAPGKFAPMFSYERSVPYPEGHRNVLFVQRGIRPAAATAQNGARLRPAMRPIP